MFKPRAPGDVAALALVRHKIEPMRPASAKPKVRYETYRSIISGKWSKIEEYDYHFSVG